MSLTPITDYRYPGQWTNPTTGAERAAECCRLLESGHILFFDQPPFSMPQDDRLFLLGQRQSGFQGHKNISYRPRTDELRGAAGDGSPDDARQLKEIMRRFSRSVAAFVDSFLAPYAEHRQLDFASYRPIEEQDRDLPLHKRNTLAHVDAFPTRPTHGGRILRVFLNINPNENRVWETTDPFDVIAPKFAPDAGLQKFADPSPMHRALATLAPLLKKAGVRGADRSAYDRFMLHFHDYLKENDDYQRNYPKQRTEFPPNSVWLVYTDTVPHAVRAGRFALEQTLIIPLQGMLTPQTAPIKVLETLCGHPLTAV
jgi:hypothetical protein